MKKELGIFLLLVALIAIMASRAEWNFLTAYNVNNLLRSTSFFGILGIGVAMVIITGGIDLSLGSLCGLAGISMAMLMSRSGPHLPWPLALLVVLAGCCVVGAFHGFMVAKIRMQPFIVTLCALMFYRGITRRLAGDMTKGFNDEDLGFLGRLVSGRWKIPAVYDWMPTGMHDWLQDRLGAQYIDVPYSLAVLVVVATVMFIVLHRSVYGRYLMAVGRNEDAARYSGINDKLIVGSAYVLCSLLAGIAAVLLSIHTASLGPADLGKDNELYAIAAAVLGGCSLRGGEGSIIGILIGAAILQILPNMVNLMGIPSELNQAVIGAVIFIGVLVDQLVKQRNARKVKVLK